MSHYIQLGYYVLLSALTLWVMLKGCAEMKRTIWTIIAVAAFSLTLAYSGLWPSFAYAMAMVAADFIALLVITMRPADKWQSVIGLTYVFQITTWIAYMASRSFYGRADMDLVWWGLTIPALLQLALVGGWISGGRMVRSWHRGRDHKARAHSSRQGVGR